MSDVKQFITRWSRDFQGNLQEDPNGSWVLAADAAIRDKRLMDKLEALQQRLTAADERADAAISFVTRLIECAGGQPSIATGYLSDILDVLKPAGGSTCNESTACPKCNGTGEADSGGVQPWGEGINIPCDCKP